MNKARILYNILDILPDAVGTGTVTISFLQTVDGKLTDEVSSETVLSNVCDENVWDVVDAVAKYLDEAVPGYRCAKQSAQFRAKEWIRPALWAGTVVVKWD